MIKDGIILKIPLWSISSYLLQDRDIASSLCFDQISIEENILLIVKDCHNCCLFYVKKKQNFVIIFVIIINIHMYISWIKSKIIFIK